MQLRKWEQSCNLRKNPSPLGEGECQANAIRPGLNPKDGPSIDSMASVSRGRKERQKRIHSVRLIFYSWLYSWLRAGSPDRGRTGRRLSRKSPESITGKKRNCKHDQTTNLDYSSLSLDYVGQADCLLSDWTLPDHYLQFGCRGWRKAVKAEVPGRFPMSDMSDQLNLPRLKPEDSGSCYAVACATTSRTQFRAGSCSPPAGA